MVFQDQFEYTISKRFEFSASHQLKGLLGTFLPNGQEHPCSRRHGHNYVVEITLRGTKLDDVGFLVDYHDLAPLKAMLDERFDHRDLNEVLQIDDPTAEVIARRILRWAVLRWPKLDVRISVEETPKTRATVQYTSPRSFELDPQSLLAAIATTLKVYCLAGNDESSASIEAFLTAAYQLELAS